MKDTVSDSNRLGLLASSPDAFSRSAGIITIPHVQFANKWGSRGELQRTNTGVRLELPVVKIGNNLRVVVLACKKPKPYTSPKDHSTIGLILDLDTEGYYNRFGDAGVVDVDRLFGAGTKFHFETTETRGETKTFHVEHPSLGSTIRIPKTCQIVLKGRTLSALRQNHDIDIDVSALKVYQTNQKITLQDWWQTTQDTLREQYAGQWVERVPTKEKDFVLTFQYDSATAEGDSTLKDMMYTFGIWINRVTKNDQKATSKLGIHIDPHNPCLSRGCSFVSK